VIAVDTNVLVRVATNDDRMQAQRAMRAMRSDRAFVSRTVILETAWVLRHAYGLDDAAIGHALKTLTSIASIEIEARSDVLRALAWHARGMDIADALHLAASRSATAFLSFDRALGKNARKLRVRPAVVHP
jgi:predicted nucleic-acid-binding protein